MKIFRTVYLCVSLYTSSFCGMNLAKSVIVSEKKLFQSWRTYAVKWPVFAENQSYFYLPATEIDSILKEQSLLFDSN
jgi:hypothetical protein